jgi:hypothetical protein
MISQAQLEALTSAGVVRRAGKALGKSELTWKSQTGLLWPFEFESFTGQLNLESVQDSQCDCPAAGLCKHIVAAGLIQSKQGKQSADGQTQSVAPFAPPELILSELCKEAGKAACRYAYQHFSSNQNQIIVTEAADHHALAWPSFKAIFGSGQGLSSITVEDGEVREQLLAAALYLTHNQQPLDWPDWLADEKQAQTKARDQQISQAKSQIKQQLVELVLFGVANLQSTNLLELEVQVQPLKSQGLGRLANGINSLVEWTDKRSEKLGLDPTRSILRQMAQLYAQCESILPPATHQSQQLEQLNLFCLGGHQWTTASGSLGLSMVFICEQGQLYNASIMRQQQSMGFSAQSVWSQQILWDVAPLNESLVAKYFSLNNAKLNHWQSLSLSQHTQYASQSSPNFELTTIDDWQEIKTVEVYGYALLSVKKWHDCRFNEANQKLVAQIEDNHKQLLIVEQSYSAAMENRIVNLMDSWSNKPNMLLVRHILVDDCHTFEPIAVYHKNWLSLDFKTADKSSKSLLARAIARFKQSSRQSLPDQNDLSVLLAMLEQQLTQYPHYDEQRLQEIGEQLKALGLDLLHDKLVVITKEPAAFLQLAYFVGALKTLAGGWPIYPV